MTTEARSTGQLTEDEAGIEAPARRKTGVLVLNTQKNMFAPQYIHATLVRLLDRARFAPRVAISDECVGARVWEEALGEPVWTLPLGTSVTLRTGLVPRAAAALANLRMIPGLLRLAARMRREGIDVIHTETKPRDALCGTVLSVLGGAKLVIHWHTLYWGWYPLVWKLAFRRATAILAVSEASRRSLMDIGVPGEKIHVLYNGLDVRRFRPGADGAAVRAALGIPPEAFVVLLTGRLCPDKGQGDLLRAVGMLKARGHEVSVLLVGRDDVMATPGRASYRAELEALAHDLGIEGQVYYLDHSGDMPAVNAAADVVTLPSYTESFGMVLAEGMACGKPVVGTLCGGIPEMITEGETGLLVPIGEPADLAAALERLVEDPALRAGLGENARRAVVERFSQERMAADAGRLFEAIARGESPRGS